jgi:hypothetical protein
LKRQGEERVERKGEKERAEKRRGAERRGEGEGGREREDGKEKEKLIAYACVCMILLHH